MPKQNSNLPDGMRWYRRFHVGRWSNALLSAAGACATEEGTPLATE